MTDQASQVTTARSQVDAALELLADAERAQMERDCAAVCVQCYLGYLGKAKLRDGEWYHENMMCNANKIRIDFAALHPEPAP